MGRGGKVVFKSGGGGGGTDDDEEYVVGEDGEEGEEEVSDDCYSSDASLEASQDAEVGGCSEEEEEEEDDEYDWLDDEDVEAAGRRRRTKGTSGPARKPAAKPLRGERSSVSDEGGDMEDSPIGKPRATRRRRPEVFAEGEGDEIEEEEDDDEDFAPDEDEEEEDFTTVLARKSSCKRSRPAKRQKRRTKPRKAQVAGKKKKKEKPLGRKRRRRTAPGSDDDDFIVQDRVSEDGADRKRRGLSNGRKRRRRLLSSSPDPSDSSASDVDYTMSEDELRDLQVGGASRQRVRIDLSSGVQEGKKGKGKEVDDVGKRVCGICLSEEHNRVIRGMLDCCAHYFCFACIMEWSKVESKCPVCKRRFTTVSKSARSEAGFGLRAAVIRIPVRDQVYQPSAEEVRGYLDPYANVVCLVCQQGGDDNLMLLCDICDSSAHTYCVGLGREVPEGNWYCDGCRYTDPASSNLRVQDSALEHGTSHSDVLHEEFCGVNSDNIVGYTFPAITQHSSSLSCQAPTSQGTVQDTFIRCQTLSGDHGTTSYVSGFASSTLSGRRSIQQRIRIILSNNRVRTIPVVARNNVIQSSSLESCLCDFETQHNGDLHPVPQESLTNGVNERRSTSFPRPRICMNSHIPNDGNSFRSSEGAKKQVKATVKRHLNYLARDTSLGRRDLKEIAGHATHTILAACGFQHRQSKVTTVFQVPSNCVHLADGDLTGLVKGCCSSCFAAFVENVVQEIFNSKLRSPFHA